MVAAGESETYHDRSVPVDHVAADRDSELNMDLEAASTVPVTVADSDTGGGKGSGGFGMLKLWYTFETPGCFEEYRVWRRSFEKKMCFMMIVLTVPATIVQLCLAIRGFFSENAGYLAWSRPVIACLEATVYILKYR